MRKSAATDKTSEPQRLLQARLPAALVRELRILALEQDLTVRELVNRLVADYVAQHRRVGGRKG